VAFIHERENFEEIRRLPHEGSVDPKW